MKEEHFKHTHNITVMLTDRYSDNSAIKEEFESPIKVMQFGNNLFTLQEFMFGIKNTKWSLAPRGDILFWGFEFPYGKATLVELLPEEDLIRRIEKLEKRIRRVEIEMSKFRGI